jgi:hypothetical protein
MSSPWRMARYRRWRWNKLKHHVRMIISPSYRKEIQEYEAHLAIEIAEVKELLS